MKQADEKPQGWTDTNCTSDPTKCWKQTFSFDRYGNRRFDEGNTTMPASFANPAVTNPTISPNTNKLTSTGYSFDAAGNTVTDAESRSFIYDSENKQVEVKDGASVTIGQYIYDGDGKRVKKYVPSTGETTLFVYDAGGKLVAEYSTIVASINDAKVAYLTNDHLGSPRINTDASGTVTARHDYHPFGEEISTPQRTTGVGYADDAARKQFTAYERDNESDLDYAQARYYNSKQGRFTSVDPAPFIPADPQSPNRYIYVQNNPLKFIDPTGEILRLTGDDADYFVSELEASTGYKLKRDKKTGLVTINTSVKRNSKGTSRNLADKLNQAIGLKDKNGKDVEIKIGTVRDSGSDPNNPLFDSFQDRTIDVDDYKAFKNADPAFAAAGLGHILEEYIQAETTFKDEAKKDKFDKSHEAGKNFESKVLSDFTGKVEQSRVEINLRGIPQVGYKFTSVRYDVLRKTDVKGNITGSVGKVTKVKQ